MGVRAPLREPLLLLGQQGGQVVQCVQALQAVRLEEVVLADGLQHLRRAYADWLCVVRRLLEHAYELSWALQIARVFTIP